MLKLFIFVSQCKPLDAKPLPLRQTEADEYMLALKQELRGCMRELPYFVKANVKTKGKKVSIFATKEAFLQEFFYKSTLYHVDVTMWTEKFLSVSQN